MNERLAAALEARRADGRGLAILLIDCGLISRIDAAWGYAVGDAVRASVAESMRADVLREDDFVMELGREQVACVLSTVNDPAVPLLAAEKSLRALNVPLWVGEEEIFPDAAIGIAVFPRDGDDAEGLLARARGASLRARGLMPPIAEHDGSAAADAARLLIERSRLRTAVKEDALELTFQPQHDLQLGPIMGAQVRLRWRDAAAGSVSAERAFAAAEAGGVIPQLVSSILNRALRNVSEFRYKAGLDLRVGVQLPARALLQVELPEVIERSLGTWRLRAGRLCLQVGGTSLLQESQVALETLLALKKVGVRLSIDDPQVAMSALPFLAGLPFQEIRLDASSLTVAPEEEGEERPRATKTERIFGAWIELAHALGLDVCAYSVTDEHAAAHLKDLGCDTLQADFRGPALDAEGFVERYS